MALSSFHKVTAPTVGDTFANPITSQAPSQPQHHFLHLNLEHKLHGKTWHERHEHDGSGKLLSLLAFCKMLVGKQKLHDSELLLQIQPERLKHLKPNSRDPKNIAPAKTLVFLLDWWVLWFCTSIR